MIKIEVIRFMTAGVLGLIAALLISQLAGGCNLGVTLNERRPVDIAVDEKAGVWVIANDGSIWFLINNKGVWRRVADLPPGEYENPPELTR